MYLSREVPKPDWTLVLQDLIWPPLALTLPGMEAKCAIIVSPIVQSAVLFFRNMMW